MPYVPRPATTAQCAHCNATFEKRHASRKYCSNSCNVQASYARTGYRSEGRATRADLEQMLAEMKQLMLGQLPPAPAAKAAATKPKKKIAKPTAPAPAAKAAAKARFAELAQKAYDEEMAAKPATPAPAAKAAATKPKKKITATAPSKPAAKAAAPKKNTPTEHPKGKAYQARLEAAKVRLQAAAAEKKRIREEEEYLGWQR